MMLEAVPVDNRRKMKEAKKWSSIKIEEAANVIPRVLGILRPVLKKCNDKNGRIF